MASLADALATAVPRPAAATKLAAAGPPSLLAAFADVVRTLDARPLTGADFHPVKLADVAALEATYATKLAAGDAPGALAAVTRLASVADTRLRRAKLAAAVRAWRGLTLLRHEALR